MPSLKHKPGDLLKQSSKFSTYSWYPKQDGKTRARLIKKNSVVMFICDLNDVD